MAEADAILGQIGLIFSQIRRARVALEEIERSTARYTGLAFAPLLTEGAGFGAPPLLSGALKVYVVNINDLRPGGGGIGEFFGNLLGGIGSFIGGLGGSLVGGFLGSLSLRENLVELRRITAALPPILQLIRDLRGGGSSEPSSPELVAQQTALIRALTAILPPLTDLVRALGENLPRLVDPIQRLFNLFTGGPRQEGGAAQQASPPLDWIPFLRELTNLVKALTLLLPVAVGGLASVIVNLRSIQRVLTDLLTWALRMLFLLRGSVLVVIFDTLAASAHVGSEVLRILGVAVERVLSAVFTGIEQALVVGMDLLRLLGAGIGNTLTRLLQWLSGTLWDVLTGLGNLRVFRMIFRLVEAGHAFMSILHDVITGRPAPSIHLSPPGGSGPSGTATGAGAATSSGRPAIAGPDLAEAIAPVEDVASLMFQYSAAASGFHRSMTMALNEARSGLDRLSSESARQALAATATGGTLAESLGRVRAGADDLGSALERARGPEPGALPEEIRGVAEAYQNWLDRGGMQDLLGSITEQFRATPASGPAGAESIPGRVVGAVAESLAPARATVSIGRLEIVVEPPAETPRTGQDSFLDDPDRFRERAAAWYRELELEQWSRV